MTQPAPMQEEPPGGGGDGGGNVFTNKVGPFPLWVWMGLSLAILLAITNWKKQKTTASTANQGTLPTNDTASGSTPASLIPQFVNQVYNNPGPPTQVTVNTPVTVDTDNDPTHPTPPPPPPPHGGPPPPKPAPKGQWVTVGVWNSTNAPWNSTLWGIANHIYGNGALDAKIFAANKKGVMRPDGSQGVVSDINLVHPGDRIWVPQ